MYRNSSLIIALVLAGFAGAAAAAGDEADAAAGSELSADDQQFIMDAAQGGKAEVELGQLASERAQSPDVKLFAQTLVNDHGKANEKLKGLLEQKGVEPPATLSNDQQELKEELSQLSGAEFDQKYMSEMIDEHKEDVEAFEEQAEDGEDQALRSFAMETLPTLKDHLERAQTIEQQL